MARKSKQIRIRPSPLPDTNKELFQGTRKFTLIDRVDAHFMNGLYEEIKPFIEATDNDDAQEGALRWDRARALLLTRNYAADKDDDITAKAKMSELSAALTYVLLRHKISARQRIAIANMTPREQTPSEQAPSE